MPFVIVGLLAGVGAALSNISWVHGAISGLTHLLVALGTSCLTSLVHRLPHQGAKWGTIVVGVGGGLMPAILVVALVALAAAARSVRRAASAVLVTLGLVGLFVLPLSQGAGLLAAGVVCALGATFLDGAFIQIPTMCVAGAMGCDQIRGAFAGHTSSLAAPAQLLGHVSSIHPQVWVQLLTGLSVGLVLTGAMLALRPRS